jgi:Family of unknown function (DUF6184)
MHRLALAALVLLSGCLNVESARESAAQHSCNFYGRCGDIAPGKTFASFDECLTKQRAFFLDLWSTASCGGINPENYDICIKGIDNTQCNNGLDYLSTLSKCGRGNVCKSTGCNCTSGETCCGNFCTDLRSDRSNCGGCGTSCGAGLSCSSGVCR